MSEPIEIPIEEVEPGALLDQGEFVRLEPGVNENVWWVVLAERRSLLRDKGRSRSGLGPRRSHATTIRQHHDRIRGTTGAAAMSA